MVSMGLQPLDEAENGVDETDPETPGTSQPGHDLLSGAADLLDGSSTNLVVLRLEVMTGKEIKVWAGLVLRWAASPALISAVRPHVGQSELFSACPQAIAGAGYLLTVLSFVCLLTLFILNLALEKSVSPVPLSR